MKTAPSAAMGLLLVGAMHTANPLPGATGRGIFDSDRPVSAPTVGTTATGMARA
jgi:hypothetical protein